MVEDILKRAVDALSALDFVEGVVLGGSRARGAHKPDSDIDIGVYYDGEKLDIAALNRAAADLDDEGRADLVGPPMSWGPWVNCGGWLTMENMHVDLILRDLKRVQNVIEQTGRGEVSFHYQTGHPHACANVMYRGEMAVCRVLYAKCEKLYALQNEARVYPDIMRENLLNHCLFEAGFSLSIARSTLPRQDLCYTAGHLFRAAACMNQALFALNRAYCLNEKGAAGMIEKMPLHPKDYASRLNALFAGLSRAEQCLDAAGALLDEIRALREG